MLDIRPTSIRARLICLVISVCLAVALVTILRKVQAAPSRFPGSPAEQAPKTIPINGTVNGKVVFSSDRNTNGRGFRLWTMKGDGSNVAQLTTLPTGPDAPSYAYDFNARFSPEGATIAFQGYGRGGGGDSNAIYVIGANGGDVQRIVIASIPEIGRFEWSPDGTKFLIEAGVYAGIDEFIPSSNIYVVGTDGKNVRSLTNDANFINEFPAWSPDGKLIAFASTREGPEKIFVMDADGSNQHPITPGGDYSMPSWAPDGSKILFVGPGNVANCHNASCNEIYTINSDGSQLKQLTHYPGNYTGPRYSPDGTKILFERHLVTQYTIEDPPYGGYVYRDDGYAIFAMDADGSHQANISNHFAKASDSDFGYNVSPAWQSLSLPKNDPPPSILSLTADLYLSTTPLPPKTEITVLRNGNLDQAVSCDYQIPWNGQMLIGSPEGTITFAPGETSKTIEYPSSVYFSDTIYVHLSDVAGNATFVGGIKDALISSAQSSSIGNTDFFVRQQYEDFLNRDPDELGWRFWNIDIYTCGGLACRTDRRADVSASFFLSIEFQNTGYLVYRIYKSAYGDVPGTSVPIKFNEFLPDTQEIGHNVIVGEGNWQQQLETNKQTFAREFVQRPRFVTTYPTGLMPSQFVDALFTNAGVTPSAAERLSAIDEFGGSVNTADNAARARVLRRVAENSTLAQQEFNRAFVLMQYFGYLRRNPNDAPDSDFSGYDFWLNKLNQFNGDYKKAEMVKAFIGSGEYRRRFGP